MLARRFVLVFALGGVFACGAPAPVCPVLPPARSVSPPPAVEALPPAGPLQQGRFLPTMVVADEEGVIVTREGLPFLEEPTSPAFLGLAAAVEEALADRGIGRAVDFAGELSVRETTVREPIRPLPPLPRGTLPCWDRAEPPAFYSDCRFGDWEVSGKGTTTTRTDAARPGDYLAYPRFWGRCLDDRSVPRSPGGISLRIERRFVAVAKGNSPETAWKTTGPASGWARILVTREVLRKGQPLPLQPVDDPAGGPLFRSPLAALVGVHCGR